MNQPVLEDSTPKRVDEAPALPPMVSLGLIAVLAVIILYFVPRPAGINPEGWRMLAIFLCTILGLTLRPLPVGAVVLIGISSTILTGVLTLAQALSAYGSSSVWLVLSAFFIARALIGCGLARRIALIFVRAIGHRSLGLGYSLVATDLILAGIIPSNSARVGGVIFPVTRTLAQVYNSRPGPTAALLGTYLMLTIYHGDLVACAMFITGQASNPLAAELALKTAQVKINWASWLWAALLPGLAGIVAVPWVIYRLSPPEIRHTPEAAQLAARELKDMGPLSRDEKVVLLVFLLVCGVWSTSALHSIQTTTGALLGVAVLLMTRALSWEDAMKEHVAWDVFIWYGGMIRMGEALNEFGLTSLFAQWVSGHFTGWGWPALMAVIVLIYFYIHYAFASLTSHFISLYAPFLAVLLTAGAPAPLAAYAMLFFTNLSASLTHYGTTHSPIVYSAGYISIGLWWKIGLLISFVHLGVWTAVGLGWWRLIGLW